MCLVISILLHQQVRNNIKLIDMATNFRNQTKEVMQESRSDYVGLEDIVSVNGIVGHLDFIGEEIIALIGENGEFYKIDIKDIHSIVKHATFRSNNMTNVPINSLIHAA